MASVITEEKIEFLRCAFQLRLSFDAFEHGNCNSTKFKYLGVGVGFQSFNGIPNILHSPHELSKTHSKI